MSQSVTLCQVFALYLSFSAFNQVTGCILFKKARVKQTPSSSSFFYSRELCLLFKNLPVTKVYSITLSEKYTPLSEQRKLKAD